MAYHCTSGTRGLSCNLQARAALRARVPSCRSPAGRARLTKLQVRAGPLVKDITESDFEAEVLKSSVPVLVDFWATWCGPCKLVAPSMDWAAKEYGLKVVKVDADPNPKLIEQFKVQGLPTLMIFKDGQKLESSHWEGAITRKQLAEYLEKHHIKPVVNAA